jgi:hypothetical protein
MPQMKLDSVNFQSKPLGVTGRISAQKAAEILGFALHDIPTLIRRGLLKPLGKPAPNAPKYFAVCELLNLQADRGWLDRASKAVSESWKEKNQRKYKH